MPDKTEMIKLAKAAATRLREAAEGGTLNWFELTIGSNDGWSIDQDEVTGEFTDAMTREHYRRESRRLVPHGQPADVGVLRELLNSSEDYEWWEYHLCRTCRLEFATCVQKTIIFGIDVDQDATGGAADVVLECSSYRPTGAKW